MITRKIKSNVKLIKDVGALQYGIRTLERIERHKQRKSVRKKQKMSFLAKYNDLVRADWSNNPYTPTQLRPKPPYKINWVISPPGNGAGGGHQNIFRFLAYLAKNGHKCSVYLYSSQQYQSAIEAQQVFNKAYPSAKVSFQWLKEKMEPADAVFATGWETAYPVFNNPGSARKFYFIQDFEPYFYPVGSEYILAENTYHFNFYGITAGNWLAHKLKRDYGMSTDHYDFGADKALYRFENTLPRKKIFFYARPVTARRGFELGLMALQIFHETKPDYKIVLAGWDVSEYEIPFPYENLKTLTLEQLSDVYNQSAAALVVSLTNMSLMPLELLAAGTIPVVTDGPNNVEVSDNPFIKFAHASPGALAKALVETVERDDLPQYAKEASGSVAKLDWEKSGKVFEEILRRELNG